MPDQYIGPERRSTEQAWKAFSVQLANLHNDVGDIKAGMADFKDGLKELAAAILKLALVEERLAQTGLALEHAFKLLERMDAKIEAVSQRVVELEKTEPAQSRVADWVDRVVWAAAAATVATAASRLGFFS